VAAGRDNISATAIATIATTDGAVAINADADSAAAAAVKVVVRVVDSRAAASVVSAMSHAHHSPQ